MLFRSVQAQQSDCEALTGNAVPKGSSFGEICFEGTFVESDLLSTFTGGQLTLF